MIVRQGWAKSKCFVFLAMVMAVANGFAQETAPLPQAGVDDFLYAKRLLAEGYHEVAIGQFRNYLAKYPDSPQAPEAMLSIGQAQFALKKFSAAAETFAQFEARYPNHPFVDQVRRQLAESLVALKDDRAAASAFQRLAMFNATSPLAPPAQYRAAELWIAAGEHDKARALLYKLMEDYPTSAQRLSAHLLLVESFRQAGDAPRALEEAERLFRSFPSGELTAEAYFAKGRLQEQVGQFQLAEETYMTLVQLPADSVWTPRAQTRLAEFAYLRGEIDKASELFKNASSRLPTDLEKNSILLRHTEVLIDTQRHDAAQSVLANFATAAADSGQILKFAFAQGMIHESRRDYQKAVQAYTQAIHQSSDVEKSLHAANQFWRWPRQRSFLRAAACELNADNPDGALAFCAAYRRAYPGASGHLADVALWQEAEIRRQAQQDYAAAARLYQQIIDDHPSSRRVDDAQLQLATMYELMNEQRIAVREYRRLLENYPASEHYAVAAKRFRLLEEFSPRDNGDAFSAMSALLAKISSGENSGNVKLELATLSLQRRNFEEAAALFGDVLARSSDAETTRLAQLQLAKTYGLMAERADLRDESAAQAFRDSAVAALSAVLNDPGASSLTEEAGIWLARMRFPRSANVNSLQSISQADSTLAQHADRAELDFLRLWTAQARIALARQDTAQSGRVVLALQQVAARENSPWRNEANYTLARWRYQAGDTTAALQLCKALTNSTLRDPFLPRALLLRARMLHETKHYGEAAQALKNFQDEYFYSALADSARDLRVLNLMLARRFDEAIKVMESAQVLHGVAGESDGSTLLLGRAYAANENYPAAIHAYLKFLREHPASPEAGSVLLAAANLTAKTGARELARQYAEECIRRFPASVRSADAKNLLADLHFGDGKFDEARGLYQEVARESPDYEKKQRAARQALICSYKTPKGVVNDADLKAFQKAFPSDKNGMAEIHYAAGEQALMNKDYETAGRFFNTLRKDYKDTPSGILGDYGLGKSLLMQNKAKDALEILTEIPRRYPNHPFLSTVYLGLGDFYQSQQQWDNAITSFNKVIADSAFDSNYRLAVRSLINCYDRLGLWDRALGYMRGYLAKFPDDEYAFLIKMQIGTFLINLMQYDDAIAHLRKLKPFADAQTEPEIQYYIGKSYMNAGRFELAIPEFLRVKYFSKPTKLPWDVTALYEAGICFMRLKDYEKAKSLFSRIVREQGAESNFGRFAKEKINELEQLLAESSKKDG